MRMSPITDYDNRKEFAFCVSRNCIIITNSQCICNMYSNYWTVVLFWWVCLIINDTIGSIEMTKTFCHFLFCLHFAFAPTKNSTNCEYCEMWCFCRLLFSITKCQNLMKTRRHTQNEKKWNENCLSFGTMSQSKL